MLQVENLGGEPENRASIHWWAGGRREEIMGEGRGDGKIEREEVHV